MHINKSKSEYVIVIKYYENEERLNRHFCKLHILLKNEKENVNIINQFKDGNHFNFLKLYLLNLYRILLERERVFYLIDLYSELFRTRDKFMPYHMSNVAKLAVSFAQEMGLNDNEIYKLNIASLLHDIGKLYVSEKILNKRGELTSSEYNQIKKHTIKGYNISKTLFYEMNALEDIPNIILCYPERYDGSGYPNGLSRAQIPFLSRIICVADAIDAMLSLKPYKEPMTLENVIIELNNCKGKQFDPIVTNVAINVLQKNQNSSELLIEKELFIPNVLCTLFCKDKMESIDLVGSIQYYKTGLRFIPSELISKETYINCKQGAKGIITIINNDVFKKYDLLELSVHKYNITCRLGNEIPIDKYFSIKWNTDIDIIYLNEVYNLMTVQIGASHIILKDGGSKIFEYAINGEIIDVKFVLNIKEDTLIINEKMTINHVFDSLDERGLILEYVDLSTTKRDHLLKMLFKKQVSSLR